MKKLISTIAFVVVLCGILSVFPASQSQAI